MNKLMTRELTLDSRDVAEMVEKNHADILRDIRTYIEYLGESKIAFTDFFIRGTYTSNQNKELTKYDITKKGCEFIAHKLTGQKGALFTATYINKFYEMEETINKHTIPNNLSPQLQLLISMELKQTELETAVTETKKEVQAIRDVITINPKAEWRKETNNILVKIGKKMDDYSKPRNEVYEALQHRASCRPNVLVNNLKKRALENGMAPSKVDKLNILDVLENNPRLKEIYITIVKEMSINHNIT